MRSLPVGIDWEPIGKYGDEVEPIFREWNRLGEAMKIETILNRLGENWAKR